MTPYLNLALMKMADEQPSLQPDDFRRLQQRQLQAIENCKVQLMQWEKFNSDYQSLQETLLKLPEKVTHDVMVPFGRLAFMPGQLHHTNEILVLLGDNWFAMRSAKQASGIVDRRKRFVLEKLELCREQLKNLQAQVGFTEEFQEVAEEKSKFVEIKEECRAEDEQGYQYIGNVRHRVARTPRWAASQPGRKDAPYQQEDSQDRLWARLEELEREEVREEEEEEVREEEEEGEREAAPAGGLSNVEAVCTGDSKHLEDSHPLTQRITFQHTRTRDVVVAEDWDSKQAGPRTIRHPGDIHRLPSHLGRPLQPPDEVTVEEEGVAVPQGGKKGVRWSRELEEVKSIPSHRQEEEEEKEEARVINPTPPSVFSGVVTERTASSSLDKEAARPTQMSVKKVSKFKASRQKT